MLHTGKLGSEFPTKVKLLLVLGHASQLFRLEGPKSCPNNIMFSYNFLENLGQT